MREVQQPLAPSMGKERGGAKLIDWLDELTMIRAVRSVRNCRRCCNGTSHTTLWGRKLLESLQPRIGYICNSSRSSDEPRGNEACHPSPTNSSLSAGDRYWHGSIDPLTRNDTVASGVKWPTGLKTRGSKAAMSRKEELLKLAKLFHSQASRTGTPGVKQTLHRMGQYYQNEAAHAPDRDPERQRGPMRLNRYRKQAA